MKGLYERVIAEFEKLPAYTKELIIFLTIGLAVIGELILIVLALPYMT